MVTKAYVVDANDTSAITEFLSLTNEAAVSLYVFSQSGTHKNRRIGLEATPNGVNWVRIGETLKKDGHISIPCSAVAVRPYVSQAEGQTSSAIVIIIAR